MQDGLKIVLVEEDADRARTLIEGLADDGWGDVTVLGDARMLARQMDKLNPDVVLVNLADPGRDTLEQLCMVSGANERPVAVFVDRTDPATTKAAIEAGLSAYVVGGLEAKRVRPIVDAAIARFHMFSQIRTELEAAKTALSERKMVDRAKGLLMKAKGISEDEAYALLRKAAMDQGKRLAAVAEAIVTAANLLK
ncbi:ANTAR domain-containing response regulator [Pseudooceanicola nanhaiensis]|uniref:ANTAR domain-containing response regulator n=1 Tax=Pseudooceanicola nanhaiensis TaxID=375761 RepID=UPI001CD4979B|nr:ANTAR domain-containing protein [Pseudooceanicola nanhaiensis]MCA0919026.1 ANTAR domain-containing protein [Pseudooceanicola nanhaiensis]